MKKGNLKEERKKSIALIIMSQLDQLLQSPKSEHPVPHQPHSQCAEQEEAHWCVHAAAVTERPSHACFLGTVASCSQYALVQSTWQMLLSPDCV